ncbi:16S rRNA (cytosine(967)-C(5))-methyltransferase RsmB [Ideonella azotifigens]|uniref:16S rRNA (cytosine(967)-C(5))-methyltransferase n=1 Tax=Ideonella azotifigens TaxID=513160 RepID=A0ABP3UUZ5_9BURK|nr:16S rRNA (cytosine(967)-C(5))-methyltransferase RsmB [Ideonella azotifigens]
MGWVVRLPRVNPAHPSPPLSRLLELCADAVQAVRAGRSLTDVLAGVQPAARPGTQALAFAVLRRLGAATAARAVLAPRNPPPVVDALLVCALALLWPDDAPPYPDHTLVDQAVTAARHKVPAAAGFINAVLRRFIRERAAVVAQAEQQPEGAWNHPAWWIQKVRHDWPADWQALLGEAQRHPPMTLRVNARRSSREAYLQQLQEAGIAADPVEGPGLEQALVLRQPCPVDRLPGFAQGLVSVQDLSAQRAAPLLLRDWAGGLPAGAHVLDACAAPGGKTAHLLELAELDLLALDTDASRLARVDDGLRRLGLQARTRAADARQVSQWWDGRPFDAILLDAPCSASGIVRRHPDIRWLRRADDIQALARIQAELLDALWPLLKPGGRLVYATCSLFKDEGIRQIDAFLQRHSLAPGVIAAQSPGHLLPLPDNARHLPSASLADGFYYALLQRPAAASD